MYVNATETAALIVDMQERLMPSIQDNEALVARSVILLQGLNALGIPMVVPRQYPKGLGDTIPEIKEAIGEHTPLDKMAFSALGEEAIVERFQSLGKKNVIVCGVEAHVCVLTSVIDLVAAGYQPVLVCDCIGSRCSYDKEIALQRAVQEGALLTTSEAILFELTKVSGTDTFKTISKLVK